MSNWSGERNFVLFILLIRLSLLVKGNIAPFTTCWKTTLT